MKVPFSQFWITSFSVVLAVLENSNSDTVQPIFDDSPVNITAIQGSTAILPCDVRNLGKYEIAWLNPKKILISTGDRRLMDDSRLSIERPHVPDWNLHIRKVRYEDRGMYACTLNTKPVQVKRLYLSVAVPPNIEEQYSSDKQIAREGTTVQLNCNATGVPQPKITWFRKTSYSKKEKKEAIGTPGEILIIHNITRYCDGIYECLASNGVSNDVSKEIPVEVTFPPEVRLLTKRMGQYVSKETILGCSISASPHAAAFWRKGNEIISTKSYKYRTDLYKDDPHTFSLNLRIIDIQPVDFGKYTCEATNNLGTDRETMLLYEYHPVIQEKSTRSPLTESPPLYQYNGIPIKPTKPVTITSVTERNNVNIGEKTSHIKGGGYIDLHNEAKSQHTISLSHCSIILLVTFIFISQLSNFPFS